jgi:hypothetical protein
LLRLTIRALTVLGVAAVLGSGMLPSVAQSAPSVYLTVTRHMTYVGGYPGIGLHAESVPPELVPGAAAIIRA